MLQRASQSPVCSTVVGLIALEPKSLGGGWFASSGSEASASSAMHAQGLDFSIFILARVQKHLAFFGRKDMY